MCRVIVGSVAAAVLALLAVTANAAQFGTRDEAVAMVKRVQEKFKRDGAEATFAAITSQARPFKDRDLYVYVLNYNCVIEAHAARKEMVGKSLWDFRDQDGVYSARNAVQIAITKGSGWTDYRWASPKTGLIEAKSTYVERLGDQYAVGVGVYKDEQPNWNTVSIISGSPGSDATYLQVAYELAAVLSDGGNLRVLPVVGKGGPQNIRDVQTLKGIDIGLTQTSILNNFRRGNQTQGVFDDKIVYITKLFNLEAHLVVRAGTNSLGQLQGQKVNLDELGSGTNYSMRDVFRRLGVKIQEVNMTQAEALEKLTKGEIAATVLVAGKPTQSMSRLRGSDGLAFLPIPYAQALADDFLPAELTHDDYPDMIPPGKTVETIADGAVLIAYNWPKNTDRYRRVEIFINAFFPKIAEFHRPPHHPKWREVNLTANIPGWKRLELADTWLNNRHTQDIAQERTQFEAFMSARRGPGQQPTSDSPEQNERLFQEFLKWSRGSDRR